MPAVEVNSLVVRYGSVVAVDGLSFTADGGSVLALLGPNGAGKTTTVETLEGYRTPDSGFVRVLGLDPVRAKRALLPRIGVMLQEGGVYPAMSATAALRLFASYYEHPEDPDALLDVVDLRNVARSPWRRLSGGEQQRLALALALVGRPEVAFLDEPTSGVDPAGRRAIWQVITGLRERGTCVVLTTHYMEEAERLADHVVIIDNGIVVAAGSPDELTRGGANEFRFGGPPALDTAALTAALGASVVERQPGEYLVATAGTPATVATLAAWLADRDLPLTDLRAGRQSLEEVFLRLTGEQ